MDNDTNLGEGRNAEKKAVSALSRKGGRRGIITGRKRKIVEMKLCQRQRKKPIFIGKEAAKGLLQVTSAIQKPNKDPLS